MSKKKGCRAINDCGRGLSGKIDKKGNGTDSKKRCEMPSGDKK